jgi:SAM-dependent methyltransferase
MPDDGDGAPRSADDPKAIVAAGYDALGARFDDWRARVIDPTHERLLATFEAELPPGAAVLDLGCGPGVPTTARLAARFRVTGVNISAAQLDAARRNVPAATFIHADFGSLRLAPGSFDGIVAMYSIPHLPREEHPALLDRIASWLRPGGLLLATLGADDDPGWTGPWLGEPMFFSSFDAATNRTLVERAGLELEVADVVDVLEPEGPVPFLWVLARRGARVSRS